MYDEQDSITHQTSLSLWRKTVYLTMYKTCCHQTYSVGCCVSLRTLLICTINNLTTTRPSNTNDDYNVIDVILSTSFNDCVCSIYWHWSCLSVICWMSSTGSISCRWTRTHICASSASSTDWRPPSPWSSTPPSSTMTNWSGGLCCLVHRQGPPSLASTTKKVPELDPSEMDPLYRQPARKFCILHL